MDEQEINCILNSNEIVKQHYTGTIYCADTLPLKLTKGKFYISNTKESTHNFDKEPGHWVAWQFYDMRTDQFSTVIVLVHSHRYSFG